MNEGLVTFCGNELFPLRKGAGRERMHSKHPPCITPQTHIRLLVEKWSNWSTYLQSMDVCYVECLMWACVCLRVDGWKEQNMLKTSKQQIKTNVNVIKRVTVWDTHIVKWIQSSSVRNCYQALLTFSGDNWGKRTKHSRFDFTTYSYCLCSNFLSCDEYQ